jgi:murein DD-endopeptidase MepM/ murein hydrolase activator NlpD
MLLLGIFPLEVQLSHHTVEQGEMSYVYVSAREQGLLSLEYRGEPYPLIPWEDGFISLIGTSYKTDPGKKSLRITFTRGWNSDVLDTFISVQSREFRRSDITLPPSKQGTIDTTQQRRKQEEYQKVVEAINSPSTDFYAMFAEILPCAERISGTYGDERWINGRKGWHHSGLDFAVPRGTPILAPCPGKVVMARDTFIRQGTFVMLDHGANLKTLYYHMEKRTVNEGEEVNTGDTLGFVGSSGIATGPHLHLSVYVKGIPADPWFWLGIREKELF